MKIAVTSLISMIIGFGFPFAGMAIYQINKTGRTADLGVTAMWVAIFGFPFWAVVVVPIMVCFGHYKLWSDLRFSWIGWGLLGATLYAFLCLILLSPTLLEGVWLPALAGSIAGVSFALLSRALRSYEEEPTGPS
ncbi:MAG TPA: hypothetical protein VFE31_11820 [Opitutaceae bacterium]|jgi:hypothetical protein|nr:hypothetical protein [Opitutaceae bacterium]